MTPEEAVIAIQEFNKLHKSVLKQMSQYDKDISVFYHKIETTKLTHVAKSHNLLKELKEILTKRRELKGQYHTLNTIKSLMVTK